MLEAPLCRFRANKNGTPQTGVADVTWTLVTFGTEEFDIGGHFASNVWTPPAGNVIVGGSIYGTGTVTSGKVAAIAILKNGTTPVAYNLIIASTNSFGPNNITTSDVASGTDTYGLGAYIDLNSGTGTIDGTVYFTNFWGYCIP